MRPGLVGRLEKPRSCDGSVGRAEARGPLFDFGCGCD